MASFAYSGMHARAPFSAPFRIFRLPLSPTPPYRHARPFTPVSAEIAARDEAAELALYFLVISTLNVIWLCAWSADVLELALFIICLYLWVRCAAAL